MTDFTVTKARSEVITYAYPLGQVYFSLFIKNPSGTLHYMAFIEPMTYKTWLCVGLFCILTPFSLFLSNWYVSIIIAYLEIGTDKMYI